MIAIYCQEMSRSRQSPAVVRTAAFDLRRQAFPGIGGGWPQLLFPFKGTINATVGDQVWVVPTGQGLWIGRGLRYHVRVTTAAGIRAVFFHPTVQRLPTRQPRRIAISPLLREILRRILEIGQLDAGDTGHQHLLAVLIDELTATRRLPLRISTPADPRAAAAATAIRSSVGAHRPISVVARAAATSPRTLSRLFRVETGLGVGAWRQQVRLGRAVELLGDGEPVSRVAGAVGYRSPSAFVAAFKRAFGVTPTRYFATG